MVVPWLSSQLWGKPRCIDRVGYGEPAPGACKEDWSGSSLVLGDQGPNWMSVTIHLGHELRVSTKTQMPCMIMPQNRWTCLRYPGWESEDVSNKRDTEPQQCADKLEQCLHSSYAWQLTCVRAGPPQGQVSPDKEQGSHLHQERTFGLPLVAQAQ
jgi:hypothetical protein